MAYDPNDAKDKEIVDGLIAEATSGLTAKRDQLLTEVKDLRTKLRAGGNDPEAVARLEAQVEKLEGDLEKAGADLKQVGKERDKAVKSLDTESAFTRNLLIDNGLTDALTSANVAPQFMPAVKALLSPKVALKIEGDVRKALVGEKPLGDFVKEWSQSDEGKNYVAAPVSGGGGAGGGANSGKPGAKTMARSAFEALGQAERAAFAKDGGTVVA